MCKLNFINGKKSISWNVTQQYKQPIDALKGHYAQKESQSQR